MVLDLSESPLFILAVLLAFGAVCGRLAKAIRLPSVSGQIAAGIILGPSVLDLFSHEAANGLQPVVHFALGLIVVDVGTHLHFRKLRNHFRRLGFLLLLEMVLTPLLVYITLVFLGRQDWTFGLLFGTLAVSTAPATILTLVKETRSKGVYVRTLVAAVALNNIACIAMFEMAYATVAITLDSTGKGSFSDVALAPLMQLVGALAVGGLIGGALVLATKHVIHRDQVTTVSLISILLTTGVADIVGVSSLLSCLFLGVTMVNLAPDKEEIGHRVFVNFEPAILAIFFTLAGLELNFGFLATGWPLVAMFVIARIAGKILAGMWAMRLAGATTNVKRYLGMGLIPQAGVAVGLLLQLRDDVLFSETSQMILAVGVTSVAINEIIGPITTRIGLSRSGNAGKDRERLIDFIQEENIVTDFKAATKQEALEKLVDLLILSHGLDVDRDLLIKDITEREKFMSSCIGRGIAVPYGSIEDCDKLVGVMAISRGGLPFGTPDGLPIICMVLLASPPHLQEKHFEIQAVLARSLGSDWSMRIQLYNAKTPAHVYEIIHNDDAEDFNYFLDEPNENGFNNGTAPVDE